MTISSPGTVPPPVPRQASGRPTARHPAPSRPGPPRPAVHHTAPPDSPAPPSPFGQHVPRSCLFQLRARCASFLGWPDLRLVAKVEGCVRPTSGRKRQVLGPNRAELGFRPWERGFQLRAPLAVRGLAPAPQPATPRAALSLRPLPPPPCRPSELGLGLSALARGDRHSGTPIKSTPLPAPHSTTLLTVPTGFHRFPCP